MTKRNKYLISVLGLIISLVVLSFTGIEPECSSVKNGRFHFYQNSGQYHSIIIRKDSLQTEVNLSTGDSTFWRILWVSDCQFTCSYISGSKMKSQEELDFYKKSTLTFNILKTTKKYYTYDALFKTDNNSRSFSDTMWLIAK
jgi:hypothetical protein